MLMAGVITGLFIPVNVKLFDIQSIKYIIISLLSGIAFTGFGIFIGNDWFGIELTNFNIYVNPIFVYCGMFLTGLTIGLFFRLLIKEIIS